MIKGTYVRPAPQELVGETASLRRRGDDYLARFDNLKKFSRHEFDWAFSWRTFSKGSFEIIGDAETP